MSWFLAGSAPTPVGAWQAIGAASQAASYTDLSGNGNDLSVGVAPTWAAETGWGFNGSTQYLDTGLTPTGGTWTAILRFSGAGSSGFYPLWVRTGGTYFGIRLEQTTNKPGFANGTFSLNVGATMTSGVLAVAGRECYRDGANVATLAASAASLSHTVYVGASNEAGSPGNYKPVTIQAASIYDQTLDAAEVLAVSTAMAALPDAGASPLLTIRRRYANMGLY